MSKPFWQYDLMGKATDFDAWWVVGGLGQKAFSEGLVIHKSYRNGTLHSNTTVQSFIDHIISLGCRLTSHIFPETKNGQESWLLVADDRMVDITYTPKSKGMSVAVSGLDEAFVQAVREYCLLQITRTVTRGRVYVVVEGRDGVSLQEMGVAGEDFIPENYRPETVKEYRHIVSDFKSNEPCGRIVILDGPPGTGKTHMVRALLNEVPRGTFVLVPSNMLAQLGSPSFVRVLMREQRKNCPLILVIEDADECLSSRKSDNVSAISALLNFSDGIFGAMIDMRIVATTNLEHFDLDPAVMRFGRLCRRIEIGMLDRVQAEAVFSRLAPEVHRNDCFIRCSNAKFFTLAEIYHHAKTSGGYTAPLAKPPKARMGFQPAETPAAQAGFQPGDVITTDQGDVVKVREDGQFEVAKASPAYMGQLEKVITEIVEDLAGKEEEDDDDDFDEATPPDDEDDED